ncbi:unnamed protein product [Diamesa hyperborea]
MKWLRRIIRRSTRPIPFSTADVWKRRLSIFYGVLAWNAFGFVCFAMYKGKRDWAEYHGLNQEQGTPAQSFSKTLNIPKAKVIRISGFNKTQEYELDNTGLEDKIEEIKIN